READAAPGPCCNNPGEPHRGSRGPDQPGPIAVILASAAGLLAFILAALRDGSDGFVGKSVWSAAFSLATIWLFRKAALTPARAATITFHPRGYAVTLTVQAVRVEERQDRTEVDYRATRTVVPRDLARAP